MDTNMLLWTIVGLLGLAVSLLIAILTKVLQNHARLCAMASGGRESGSTKDEDDVFRVDDQGQAQGSDPPRIRDAIEVDDKDDSQDLGKVRGSS